MKLKYKFIFLLAIFLFAQVLGGCATTPSVGFPVVQIPERDSDVESYKGKFEGFVSFYPANTTYLEELDRLLKIEDNIWFDSLYLFQIVRMYDPDEARLLEGFSADDGDNAKAFYEAVILYDYLREQELNEYFVFMCTGGYDFQIEGFPPFEPGDVILAFLSNFLRPNSLFRAPVVIAFMTDSNTRVVDEKTYVFTLYGSDNEQEEIAAEMKYEKVINAGYRENRRRLSQKFVISDLVELFKEDLESRDFNVSEK